MAVDKRVRQEFLRWLYDQSYQPNPEAFLRHPESIIDGTQATEETLEPAVRNLVDNRLVKGTGSWQRELPMRMSLTSEGRLCVDEYDADVDAWLRRNQSPTYDQSFHIGGDVTGGLIAHNTNSTITAGVPTDPGVGVLLLDALLDALPLMGLDGNQMLRQDIAELRAEIEKADVEPARTAPLLDRIKTRLVDLGVNTSGGVLASMFLLGFQHFFHLPPT